jgi:hypothetical protein
LIMDHLDPRFVWFAAGISGLLSVFGFLFLHLRSSERFEPRPEMPKQEKISPRPEFGHQEAVVKCE